MLSKVGGGDVLELALEALHTMETSCTLHVAYIFVVVREALDQFGAKLVGVHFIKFLGHHLFVSKCARIGGFRVVQGDCVDDQGVDIADRLGRNHWRGLVVCGLDRRKSTVEEGRDGKVLALVDIKSQHGLASRQHRE